MSELVIRVLGDFTVCRDGSVIPAFEVGSRKARTMLAVLAVHPDPVPVSRVALAVWGNAQPRNPKANVATLASRLRSVFGTHAIVHGRAGYTLGGDVRVDLAEAAGLVTQGVMRLLGHQPVHALMAARLAVELLDQGGVLVSEPDARWAEGARSVHSQLLRRSRHTLADAALSIGDFRAAQTAAEDALNANQFDEEAGRLLMRAHHAAGEPSRALLVHQELRDVLHTELGVQPSPETNRLQMSILQGASAQAG